MKRFLKRLVPFTLALAILASVGWYLLVYDRAFTRDVLISQARYQDSRGNADLAATLYRWAYTYTGQSEDVAIELANQYKSDGNYTKAEYTLTNAISDHPTVELYVALCKTFVEQDKLMDAVNMLDSISDPALRLQLDKLRPLAPLPSHAPGYYNEYITLEFDNQGKLYCTTDGQWPSIREDLWSQSVTLPGGETTIYALSIADNGLVSPLTVLGYTVGGVIEQAQFADPAMEGAMRAAVGARDGEILMTDQLWKVTEFTVPAEAESLDDLALLPYLEKLTISQRKLDSLSILTSLPMLTEVNLPGCRFPVGDLKILAGLPVLTRLDLSDCGLSTISDLAGAQFLTYLDLSSNTLRNLDPLIPMSSLEEVYLQHNAVTALDSLSALNKLRKLDISYNSVTNLAPLASCPELEWLNAGNNQLANLTSLDTFRSLTHLDVDHNKLTSVDLLAQCTGLTELNVSNNSLTNIESLNTLVNLVALNCAYNQLSALPSFPAETPLAMLDASHNEILTLEPLSKLQTLTYVYLDYNKLETLDPIADCFRLVQVNAYGNVIKDVSKLTDHNIIVNYDPTT